MFDPMYAVAVSVRTLRWRETATETGQTRMKRYAGTKTL